MNVRLLRLAERSEIEPRALRHFRGMGQLQPVLMGFGRHGLELRIEGVANGLPCWRVLPLPRYRAEAKAAFAELEQCNRDGRPSPACQALERGREAGVFPHA